MKKVLILFFTLISIQSFSQTTDVRSETLQSRHNSNSNLITNQALETIDFKTTKRSNSLFTDAYNFEHEDLEEIKTIVSARLKMVMSGKNMTKALNQSYNNLSESDRLYIDTIVKARAFKCADGLSQSMRVEDSL